jgi:hypothetical protein
MIKLVRTTTGIGENNNNKNWWKSQWLSVWDEVWNLLSWKSPFPDWQNVNQKIQIARFSFKNK